MTSPTSPLGFLDRFDLAWCMPESLAGSDTYDEQRAKLLALFTGSTSAVNAILGGFFWIYGSRIFTLALFTAAVVALTPPLLLKLGVAFGRVGNWTALHSYILLSALVVMTGGTRPEALIWLLYPPIVGAFFAGQRSGAIWAGVGMLTCLAMFGLQALGIAFPDVFGPRTPLVDLVLPIVLIGLNSLLFLLHARLHDWLMRSLDDAQALALAQTQRSFRALVEHSPDGIVITRDDQPQYVNPSVCRLTQYTQAQLLSVPHTAVADEADLADLRQLQAEVRRNKSASIPPLEQTWRRRDGTEVDVQIHGFAAQFQGADAVVLSIRDVTEQKRLQAKMMRMNRMIAVGTLAAGVAHEINNPLAFVASNTDLLIDQHDQIDQHALADGPPSEASLLSGDDTRDMLQDIADGAARIRDIVSGLRSFARDDQTDQTERLDMAAVVKSAIAMANHEIKHRARLVTHLPEVAAVEADESDLGQVVVNLLVNAAHAIPAGRRDSHEIRVDLNQIDQHIELTVSDTGRGIPEGVRPHIFDPFFTTKSDPDSMGLGLYIAHNTVRAHHGELTFETAVGRETTFCLSLPVADDPPPRPSKPSAKVVDRPAPTGRILIIDDEPAILRTIERTLPAAAVTTVTSAADALDHLQSEASFDAILCDLLMPQMTGMEFYAHLVEDFGDHADRVIFLTGGSLDRAARDFVTSTGRPVVSKPFDAGQLVGPINTILQANSRSPRWADQKPRSTRQ